MVNTVVPDESEHDGVFQRAAPPHDTLPECDMDGARRKRPQLQEDSRVGRGRSPQNAKEMLHGVCMFKARLKLATWLVGYPVYGRRWEGLVGLRV